MDLVEPSPDRAMSEDEQRLADVIYGAIQSTSNYSERSQQSADFRIGISDLGFCSERVRRMLAGIPEPVTDKLAAFIGTALGDHEEQACMQVWPHAIRQAEVQVVFLGDSGTYTLTGHPDLILPEGVVIDFKSTRGLAAVRRNGPSEQQQFQRHGYALGAHTGGLFHDDVTLAEVQVANVWIDRAGDEKGLYVHMEPYSEDVVQQAAMWVDDVVYAYLHDQAARKEPPREMCAKVCGHFQDCRARDTDVEGLLTAPEVLTAVDLYREATALESKARRLKDEAKAALVDVSGSTGKFTIRWVHVNESEVHYTRGAYQRLDVREVK